MNHSSKQRTSTRRVEVVVSMESISSGEHFAGKGGEPRRVLSDISLLVKRGEAWGINGKSLFEIKLLLEIIANIRPYDGGRCVLVERGMVRHKRIILRHVFYIGSSEMLYSNMNVLEFLTFAAARLGTNPVELQEQIFEFIIGTGLGSISLTPIGLLTREEKAVITLIAAAYSNSMLIVLNLPEYEFDDYLITAISKISGFIRDKGKALVIGTQSCPLIERACSHTAFAADGRLIYKGTVEELRLNFDKTEVIIRDRDLSRLMERLAPFLPGCRLSIKDGNLLIDSLDGKACDPGLIYKKIAAADLAPSHMEINPKTVQNAYEELIRQHDLQN